MSLLQSTSQSDKEVFVVSRTAKEFYMEVAALLLLQRLKIFHEARGLPRIATTNDRLGQEILARGVYEGAVLEIFIEKLLHDHRSTFASSLAIDVGANIGNHTLYFARFFGKVLAFEPNPVVADICKANVRLNKLANVEVLQLGLSDSNAVEEFHELQDDAIGSSALGRHGQAGGAERHVIKFPVDLRIGDEVVCQHAAGMNVAFVKIDVEGHELWVLRGLENTLKSGDPVVLFELKRNTGTMAATSL